MLTEINIEDDRWSGVGLEAIAEQAAAATLQYLQLDGSSFEISILACGDSHISELNKDFREKPQPTNVLSWPSEERGAAADGVRPELPDSEAEPELGDIAIAYDTCLREAHAGGMTMADHTTHLMVHAVLHLLGYDHERDQDATLMQKTEAAILGKLGLSDPYRDY